MIELFFVLFVFAVMVIIGDMQLIMYLKYGQCVGGIDFQSYNI